MTNKEFLRYLIEQEVKSLLKEDEEEVPNKLAPIRSFEEDPINFILDKYETPEEGEGPSLRETLILLLTSAFKDYITGIYIIAPKPTTFKIVLHNGQFFYLTYLGRAYEAKVSAKRYYLMTVGDKERAIKAVAGLLELGAPINTQGPDAATTSKEGTDQAAPAEETPAEAPAPDQAEEEKTES
jgi:hypothetical protein